MGSLPAGEGAVAAGGRPWGLPGSLRPGGDRLALWGEGPRLDEDRLGGCRQSPTWRRG